MEPQEKKGWLKTLALLEVGFFEIIFVGGVAALFFIIFNYFNILPISYLYPKYLSWLPHQKESNVSQISTVNQQSITPTPTGYMNKVAQDILVSFLPQILNPSFIPSKSSILPHQYKGTTNSFNAIWNTNQSTANVIFVISQNKTSLDSIYLYLSKEDDSIPSTSRAKTLTSQFFSLIPKGTWRCKPLASKGIYCENFWQEPNGVKMGIGLQQPSIKNEDIRKKVIFFCQYTKDSVNYSSKSCNGEFADTGV